MENQKFTELKLVFLKITKTKINIKVKVKYKYFN